MAQRKPEGETTFDLVLKLVENLTPEEQDRLLDEMKLQWLRKAVAEGEESMRQRGGRDAEEVFSEVISELERRGAAQ